MDRVSNANELQGWRLANREELEVIKGYFIKDAQISMQNVKKTKVVSGVFIMLCLIGMTSIFEFIMKTFKENEIADIVMLLLIMIGLALVTVLLVKNLVKSLKKNTYGNLIDAIITNNFRVNDVEIVDIAAFRGLGYGLGGQQVKVKDIYGNYCDEDIIFECHNGYQKTKALLVDISVSKNKTEVFSVKRVIPRKEYDPVLWDIGLKNYNKFVNNKGA